MSIKNSSRLLRRQLAFMTFALLTVLSLSFGLTQHSAGAKKEKRAEGVVVAQIENYDVTADGWQFGNFGNEHDAANDLTAEDLIRMFGADKVCIEGSTAKNCVLYATARKWMEEEIKEANGGHCQGMSVSSLRLLNGVGFKDKTTPAEWAKGAEVTGDLERNPEINNYITYYQTVQTHKEVYDFTDETSKKKPSEILKLIINTMKEDNDLLTLNVWNFKDGDLKDGHAIVPYKVVDMGASDFRVYVYDNNFPKDAEKFVALNTKTEEWNYRTASDPNEEEENYYGNADTHGLSLTRLSDYEKEPFTCPFSPPKRKNKSTQRSHFSQTENTEESIQFLMTGESDFVVTDPSNKRIGYDPINEKRFTEIPNGVMQYTPGGFDDEDLPPVVRLPFNPSAKQPYKITIFGKELEEESNTDFEVIGPGFVVGFEGIMLDPNETLTITISPDGQELSFTTSADGETPTIYFATEDGPEAPSYEFEIGGVQIDAGKMLTAKLDMKKGQISFKDNDGNNDKYDVMMTRTNADGTESDFEEDDLDIGKADNFQVDFGKWDGKGKMTFKTDEDGDGFNDEKPVQLENEAKKPPKKNN